MRVGDVCKIGSMGVKGREKRGEPVVSSSLILQRRVILQGNSWADFEAGNERVRVSRDERSVAEEEDLSVFSHNPSL